jgi:nitrous oxidase accessory protein
LSTVLPLVLALSLAQAPAAGDMAAAAPGTLEGRPAASETSPIQAQVDAARPGERIVIPAGTYEGDLVIDRPLTLAGEGRPLLLGSGAGSVVRVRADRVTIQGFDIDGRAGGDLGRDPSGIHVAARDVTVRDCRVRSTLFGIYLREADRATIDRCSIRGVPGKAPGEKGSGIHIWNTVGFTITGNEIVDVRDGLYIQSSSHGVILKNVARDLRYGLHYMFSDDNRFEDNRFENGAAGTALMYSKRIVFRRNQFVHNRGFASVGLLLKACDDVLAEDNLIADNARGVFLEGSYRAVLRRNVIAESDVAVVLYDDAAGHRFEGNRFVANLSPLLLVGRRTDTNFEGNYWSDNDEPDLDGDGRSDRPYRLMSVFDHLRGNLSAADLMAQGFGAAALGLAERAFPVLDPVEVVDARPLARPPVLAAVPVHHAERAAPARAGAAWSLAGLAAGAAVFFRHRRAGRPRGEGR